MSQPKSIDPLAVGDFAVLDANAANADVVAWTFGTRPEIPSVEVVEIFLNSEGETTYKGKSRCFFPNGLVLEMPVTFQGRHVIRSFKNGTFGP